MNPSGHLSSEHVIPFGFTRTQGLEAKGTCGLGRVLAHSGAAPANPKTLTIPQKGMDLGLLLMAHASSS